MTDQAGLASGSPLEDGVDGIPLLVKHFALKSKRMSPSINAYDLSRHIANIRQPQNRLCDLLWLSQPADRYPCGKVSI